MRFDCCGLVNDGFGCEFQNKDDEGCICCLLDNLQKIHDDLQELFERIKLKNDYID